MPSVTDLLLAAQAAHLDYQRHKPRMASVRGQVAQQAGDAVQARATLETAATAFRQAHEADPEHADGAWALFADPQAMLDFYDKQLAKG